MISAASPGFGARGTRNEVSTAKIKTTGGLTGSQSVMAPKLFQYLRDNLNGHFIHSISKFSLPFSRTKLKKLCFIMSCYHATPFAIFFFQLASKFNTEIYKNSPTSDSVHRFLLGLRPWIHWGLPYSKPHETAP